MVLQWMCWIIWMAMKRALSPLPSRLTEKMPTAISNRKGVLNWSVSHTFNAAERDRHHLYPVMLCRILKTSISRSGMKICESIRIVPAVPVASISTRPLPRSVSPHLPTNIVVQCQNERSQHEQRDKAMQMLKSKVVSAAAGECRSFPVSAVKSREIGWGNQIRSYVMQPYTMVKTTERMQETGNVDSVMDGGIDLFINAYLKWITLGESSGEAMPD